ncbi:MAG: hypothetical protein AVDCRST_MAG85-1632, partial [uncultured Solirubrobacteraceae bacterium]
GARHRDPPRRRHPGGAVDRGRLAARAGEGPAM